MGIAEQTRRQAQGILFFRWNKKCVGMAEARRLQLREEENRNPVSSSDPRLGTWDWFSPSPFALLSPQPSTCCCSRLLAVRFE